MERVTQGGQPPSAWVLEELRRIRSVHMKDVDFILERGFFGSPTSARSVVLLALLRRFEQKLRRFDELWKEEPNNLDLQVIGAECLFDAQLWHESFQASVLREVGGKSTEVSEAFKDFTGKPRLIQRSKHNRIAWVELTPLGYSCAVALRPYLVSMEVKRQKKLPKKR